MAISVPLGAGNVTSVVATTATSTITVPRPANAVVGDVLIVTITSDFAGPVTTATPGWARISVGRAGTMREVAVFHAFTVGGLPAAPVFTQTTNGRLAAGMFRVLGASQTERVSGAGPYASTADTANNVSFVIPATGAAASGATFAVGYNNATAAQGPSTAATFNGAAADLQLSSYGSGAAGTSSSTNQATKVSTASTGPFTLAWGKTVSNGQGVAVTVPSAGGTPDPEPEPPVNTPDVPGLAIQTGPYNVTVATNTEAGIRTASPTIPQNTKVGDVLLAVVTHQQPGGITTTTGWLQISQERATGINARALAVYEYRVLTLPVPVPTFTIAGASEGRIIATLLRLTGASTSATVLDVAGGWPTTDAEAGGTGFTIPALTGAAGSSLKLAAVYSNSAAGIDAPTATVGGSTVLLKAAAQAPGAASTVLSLFTSTTSTAKAVAFNAAVANASGFQLALAAYTPPPAASWEARVNSGGVMRAATLDGVQGSNKAKRTIDVVSWNPRKYSVANLLSTTPFFIAHRGSGDSWPEHTMEAYTNATAFGVKALELSVCTTSDGVMFCHHDLNLTKMTGVAGRVIADMTWAEIKDLYFDTRKWTGEGTPLVKPVKTEDVLNAYAGTHVIFIEDKQGTNANGLLNLMDRYPADRDRFVWKQYAGAGQWEAAKNRGYKVWGYFMPDTFSRIQELAPRFDILGIPHTASDAVISEIAEVSRITRQPVICWEVHYRWMLERLRRLGIQGMMTSNIPYVYSTSVAQSDKDSFATGRRAHGDLPHATDNWALQPRIIPGNPGVLSFNMRQAVGYVMGSMCPIPGDTYTIQFDMRFDGDTAPLGSYHSGLWFGHSTDLTHRSGQAEDVGGYHLIQRGNGVMDLMRHDPGTTAGIPLASAPGPIPALGQWTTYRVSVSPSMITAERVGVTGGSAETFDLNYRGSYFGFQKNYTTAVDVPFPNTEFRNVKWTISQMT